MKPSRSASSQPTTTGKASWRQFLSPGWIIAAIAIIAFSYFAFTFLSPWQLGKDHAIKERNERIEKAFETNPVPFASIAGADGSIDPDSEWTRVTASGHFVPDAEVLLRLRSVDGTPAFQSLTPFVIEGGPLAGTTVLVNRGWVAADSGGTKVPTITTPPADSATITGLVRVDEATSPNQPLKDQGYQMVSSINTQQIAELTNQDLAPTYIQLLPDQPGVLTAIPLPMLDRGNHLSYGLQWIAFGIMAPAGLLYFAYAEIRERRRTRAEQREMEALTAQNAKASSAGSPPPSADDTPARAAESAPDTTTDGTTSAASTETASESRPTAPARARYGSSRRNPWAQKPSAYEERM
ncbi:SURF1 family protein [Corynebacterium aquatimens]|uniref:SURF1-like protein n=1 Tax=Corynebacterium aquatimens TaxID=1190508 RepID=A0A931GSG5_9CORY|nr:SURF1 family protein [Corynebacterium aquatimens]MBG6122037.1 cytochrome oxidase assembly protein ShyY1 [Corynebacterium aquatimens]WJY65422.1 SURF1 family protein [Corynebacterium aquatimens]